jgi:hypothetical protein
MSSCQQLFAALSCFETVLASTSTNWIFFHVTGADASAPERIRVIRMFHRVHVSNFLRLAHFTDCVGLTQVFDIDAHPSLMRDILQAPFTDAHSSASITLPPMAFATFE